MILVFIEIFTTNIQIPKHIVPIPRIKIRYVVETLYTKIITLIIA